MRHAASYSRSTVQVETCAAIFEEDRPAVPDWIDGISVLDRSVLDIVTTSESRRKLPLLTDVLDKAHQGETEPDLVIYSNIDIGLMPFFYEFVANAYRSGIDGMVINRRSIFPTFASSDDLTTLYAEVGIPHPGRDCFVFTPDAFGKYDLGLVVIGAADVGRVLLWNIALHANEFVWFEDQHLTFHVGDDRSWDRFDMARIHDHNNDQAREVLARLETSHGRLLDREPWSRLPPRPPAYWSEQRWAEEPTNRLVRGQRKLRRRLRRAFRRHP